MTLIWEVFTYVGFGGMKDTYYVKRYLNSLENKVARELMTLEEYQEKEKAFILSLESSDKCLKGIVSKLKKLFKERTVRGVEVTYFCDDLDFFPITMCDDGYGCGYRNIQHISSCLLKRPEYSILFDALGHVPPIPKIQQFIERA